MSTGFDIALPKSWAWSPLKFSTTFLNRGTAPAYVDHGPVRAVSQAANQAAGLDWERTRFHDYRGDPRRLKGYLLPGDVLINSTGTGTLGRVGYFTVGPDDLPCVADGHVTVARADRHVTEPRYIYYWLSSTPFYDYIYSSLIVGATNQIELNRERLAGAPIALPPLDEQRRIADFLDTETARLTHLSEKIEAVSELSDERFRVELGKVFDDYSTDSVRLKFLLCEPLRYGANAAAEHENPSWPRYIRITDIDSYGNLRNDSFKSLDPGEARPYLLRDRDVLFARSGATVGKSFMYRSDSGPACFAGYLIRARFPESSFLPEAISFFTMTDDYWQQIAGDTIQATIQNVSAERYGNILVPYLPDEAQSKLVDEFTDRYESHRRLAALTSRQLALLAERRQALITAAVTGQFDVTTARGLSSSGGAAV